MRFNGSAVSWNSFIKPIERISRTKPSPSRDTVAKTGL